MRIVARKLILLAKQLISGKSKYIYDPEHKKKPGSGYVKTERGWTLKKENTTKQESLSVKTKKKKPDYQKHKAASDPETDVKTLELLSKDENPRIRARVAHNPNTPKKLLESLAKDGQRIVRAAVARNKKVSIKLLKQLSEDKSFLVKREVVRNSKTPIGDLKKIYHSIGKAIGQAPSIVKEEAKKKIKERLPRFSKDINPKQLKKSVAKLGDEEEEVLESLGNFKKTLGPRGQGRNEAQLKVDFIKNMSPTNYENQEAFNRAKERVSKMSVADFAIMLNSILIDEEEE